MAYLETKNQYLTVQEKNIAYREIGKGKSDYPLVMLVHLAATQPWIIGTLNSLTF